MNTILQLLKRRQIWGRTARRNCDVRAAARICVLLLAPLLSFAQDSTQSDIELLLNRIQSAYSAVENYQVNVTVEAYRSDPNYDIKKFLYTFKKKPKQLRVDFGQPYPGAVIVYPDKDGEAIIQPFRWSPFIKLHLSLDSSLLKDLSGQTIDQTDFGTLIRNMSRSLTEERRGKAEITAKEDRIEIRVLADDHFRKGATTRYLFIIDPKSWLPAGVEERAADNTPRRSIFFRNLRINIDIPAGFFNLKGG
jgi:outer membrane lipoprotein-sorting protein